MARIKEDDAVGYYDADEKMVCRECMEKDELEEVTQDDVITERDTEEDLWFCDRCEKRL